MPIRKLIMARNSEYWHEIEDVEAIKETEFGLQVLISGNTYWLPKSQIHNDSEVHKLDTRGLLIIPRWLADEKGLT
jgi:hypothetical protein